MVYMIMHVAVAALIGVMARDKTLGFWGGFIISFLFTPVVGFIVTLVANPAVERSATR